MLFDCGEGTQMQLQRAGLKPGKLSRIFISHLHGDHFYGLIGLLTSLQLAGRDKQLELYGPEGLSHYLTFMQELSRFRFTYDVPVHEVKPETEVTWEMPDFRVETRPLEHRIHSLGFRLQLNTVAGKFNAAKAEAMGIPEGPERNKLLKGGSITLPDGKVVHARDIVGPSRKGKRITICGDTRPCQNAIRLAHDTDLLVHEGTFDDGRGELARISLHSTGREAAGIAREANASRLILTHLSARLTHGDEEQMLAEAMSVFPETQIARDLMTCKF